MVSTEINEASVIDLNDLTNWLTPATSAHIGSNDFILNTKSKAADILADQSPNAVINRIKLHFPENADFLLQCRVRVVK
jgi:hypothetical protein